ncbi:hypothetical protein B0H17DRAFT_1216706 [Mycena rosella]|uniref:Uncharacterized protein n=1 Tax=Mycena rosella TaxID=1033263 RepID=A0AAD7C6F6_MYCRO|nr:hypothetical protein B0H17DRAFT_1216706 [Mycena rosella]
MPYRLRSAVPPPAGWDTAWAGPVFRVCARAHTSSIESVAPTLTASERLLLASAQETTREICRTLVGMWAQGMLALRGSATVPDSLVLEWKSEIDRLVDWLGWGVWIKCRPACASNESCYLPGAPFSMGEWNGSVPRCLRLIEPYTGLEDWDPLMCNLTFTSYDVRFSCSAGSPLASQGPKPYTHAPGESYQD